MQINKDNIEFNDLSDNPHCFSFDRIRSMSDSELKEFLEIITTRMFHVGADAGYMRGKAEMSYQSFQDLVVYRW